MDAYSQIEPLILGIGVEKAATTWVHRQLESHPDIATTYTKELGYWLKHYDKGPEWYAQQFNKTATSSVFSEYTPHYLSRIDTVLRRVSEHVDNVKFILTLRNPYERAFSGYLDTLRAGTTVLPFELACTADSSFVKKSLYAKGLKTFFEYYGKEDLHIILFDDIANNPNKVISDLYAFMGVSNTHIPEQLMKKVNIGSGASRASVYLKKLELFVKKFGLSRKHFMRIGMGNIVDRCKAHLAEKNPKPSLTQAHLDHLRQFFESDVSEVSEILKIDLSIWGGNLKK